MGLVTGNGRRANEYNSSVIVVVTIVLHAYYFIQFALSMTQLASLCINEMSSYSVRTMKVTTYANRSLKLLPGDDQ